MEQVEQSEGTKVKPSTAHPVQSLDTTTPQEAISALKMLGYPEAAAQKVVRQLIATTPTIRVEELIKQSLKLL